MSTDMTTTQNANVPATVAGGQPAQLETYLALTRPNSRAARAFQKNYGSTPFSINELDKVTVPSQGATTWIYDTIEGEKAEQEIVGVIIAMAHRGSLWQDEGEDVSGDRPPVLSAVSPWGMPLTAAVRPAEGEEDEDFGDIDPDVLEEHKLGEIDGVSVYDWQSLPYTQWGSARKGSGKRAKESVDVFLLEEDATLPLRIKIPSASIGDWGKAIRKLKYAFNECIVGLSLEKVPAANGVPAYSRVVPRYIGELSEEEGLIVDETIAPTFEASIRTQCLPDSKVAALIAGK